MASISTAALGRAGFPKLDGQSLAMCGLEPNAAHCLFLLRFDSDTATLTVRTLPVDAARTAPGVATETTWPRNLKYVLSGPLQKQ